MIPFTDRYEAGRSLAGYFNGLSGRDDVIVLALPRGGVPVAFEVAKQLSAPLDVLTVRKLGAPWNPELAFGAVATGGLYIVDDDMVRNLGISEDEIERIIAREQVELERRERLYRDDRPFPDIKGKTVIVVDDGLATGATMRVAVEALRKQQPARIIVAAPVASNEAWVTLSNIADECICVINPSPFYGVGMWYRDFSQTSDEEVLSLLDRSAEYHNLKKAVNM